MSFSDYAAACGREKLAVSADSFSSLLLLLLMVMAMAEVTHRRCVHFQRLPALASSTARSVRVA